MYSKLSIESIIFLKTLLEIIKKTLFYLLLLWISCIAECKWEFFVLAGFGIFLSTFINIRESFRIKNSIYIQKKLTLLSIVEAIVIWAFMVWVYILTNAESFMMVFIILYMSMDVLRIISFVTIPPKANNLVKELEKERQNIKKNIYSEAAIDRLSKITNGLEQQAKLAFCFLAIPVLLGQILFWGYFLLIIGLLGNPLKLICFWVFVILFSILSSNIIDKLTKEIITKKMDKNE